MKNTRDLSEADRGRRTVGGSVLAKYRILVLLIGLPAIALVLDRTEFLQHFSFDSLSENRDWLAAKVVQLGVLAPIVFVVTYAAFTVLSLPTGLFLSTLGGFLFGTGWGTFYNVVGATLGATILFLCAKTILGDTLRARAGPFLQKLEAGFRANELNYMLALRLVPVLPFWLINLAPAFLGVRLPTFVIGTFFGIIPGALVFASVGTGLGAILENGGSPDASVIFEGKVFFPLIGLALLSLISPFVKALKNWRISDRSSDSHLN